MLVGIDLRRQSQPLAYRRMLTSNETPRSLQHERHNLVTRVRGCRMTEIQAYLYGMQTQQQGVPGTF